MTDRSGIRPGREGRGWGRGRSGVLTLSSLPLDSVAITMLEPGAAERGGGRWGRGAASLEFGSDLGAGDSRLLEPAPLPESRLPPDSVAPAPGCAEDEVRPGCGIKRRRMGWRRSGWMEADAYLAPRRGGRPRGWIRGGLWHAPCHRSTCPP
jgi:hypothetical protein